LKLPFQLNINLTSRSALVAVAVSGKLSCGIDELNAVLAPTSISLFFSSNNFPLANSLQISNKQQASGSTLNKASCLVD
jgi:hypothetical protein